MGHGAIPVSVKTLDLIVESEESTHLFAVVIESFLSPVTGGEGVCTCHHVLL